MNDRKGKSKRLNLCLCEEEWVRWRIFKYSSALLSVIYTPLCVGVIVKNLTNEGFSTYYFSLCINFEFYLLQKNFLVCYTLQLFYNLNYFLRKSNFCALNGRNSLSEQCKR